MQVASNIKEQNLVSCSHGISIKPQLMLCSHVLFTPESTLEKQTLAGRAGKNKRGQAHTNPAGCCSEVTATVTLLRMPDILGQCDPHFLERQHVLITNNTM